MALFPRQDGPRLFTPKGVERDESGLRKTVLLPNRGALAAARRLERGQRTYGPQRVELGGKTYHLHVDGTVYLRLPHIQVKVTDDQVKEAVYEHARSRRP